MIESWDEIEDLAKKPDRANRVHRGAAALNTYVTVGGRDVIETGIADLITDLLHLADAADVDIEYALDCARRNYDEEREE